jgi:hypothetical protein
MSAAVVGMPVDLYGDGKESGTVTAFNDRGVTVENARGVVVSNKYSGLYARVAAMNDELGRNGDTP